MLDELLEIFERDRQAEHGQRRRFRGFFDRFNEDEDDERARRSYRSRDYDDDDEIDGWSDNRRSHY